MQSRSLYLRVILFFLTIQAVMDPQNVKTDSALTDSPKGITPDILPDLIYALRSDPEKMLSSQPQNPGRQSFFEYRPTLRDCPTCERISVEAMKNRETRQKEQLQEFLELTGEYYLKLAGFTGGLFITAKLAHVYNRKKKNRKFLFVNPEHPSQTSPKPKDRKLKKNSTKLATPPLLPLKVGKLPRGKMDTGVRRQETPSEKFMNAAFRKLFEEEKIHAEKKKFKLEAKKKTPSLSSLDTKRRESKLVASPPRFKNKITPADYKNFALENALHLGALQQETKESDNKQRVINYLASMYYLLRTTLNLLAHQISTQGHDLKALKRVRNLTVHKIMDMQFAEFKTSVTGELTKSIPQQFRELKDVSGHAVYKSIETDRVSRLFGLEGPSHTRITETAREFKTPLPYVPTLAGTELASRLDSKEPIHFDRFKIPDSKFLDWLNTKVIPILNCLSEPLLSLPTETLLKTHRNEMAALKQLIAFVGEFYHHRRDISDPKLQLLLQNARILRNKIDHRISVDEAEWKRSLSYHDGPKRDEMDVTPEEILMICHGFRDYNPKLSDFTDFDEHFTFSLSSHVIKPTSSVANDDDDIPNLAKFFKLKPYTSPLNPDAESFVPGMKY